MADPYRWLEDLAAPEVRAWVARERDHTRAALGSWQGRAALAERVAVYGRAARRTLPQWVGGAMYWMNEDDSGARARVVRGHRADQHDEIVLDPERALREDEALADLVFSPHGAYLAFAVTTGGSERRTWRILDLATRDVLPDAVPTGPATSLAWTPDERGFLYGAYPPTEDPLRPAASRMALRYHALGEDPGDDALVFEEPQFPARTFVPEVTADGRWLVLTVVEGADPRDRVYFQDLSIDGAPLVRAFDAFDAEYEVVTNVGARFWLRTTRGAPGGRVVVLDLGADEASWREVVPEGPGVLLAATRVGEHLALERLVALETRLEWVPLEGGAVTPIAFPGVTEGATLALARTPPGAAPSELVVAVTDTTRPLEVWRVAPGAPRAERVDGPAVPFAGAWYESEVRAFPSADGTPVPVRVTHPRGEAPGPRPLLLEVYGGFDVPLRPTFSPAVATWLELGGAYATAHVRGGGEFGEAWHIAGARAEKPRAIEDLLAAAKGLVEAGFTQPSELVLRGESNGGLLVAAAIVRAPRAAGAVIAVSGVHDMLRYHELGAGWSWTQDYGTAEDPALFPVLRGYSPYHNVSAGAVYPPVLVSAAEGDDRVPPSHSYKLASALRATRRGATSVLVRVEPGAGHGGPTRRAAREAAAVDELVFAALAVGLTPADVRAALGVR